MLTATGVMKCAVHYRFVNVNITVPDLEVIAAIRISANPRLIVNRRPLAAKIGQGYQFSRVAFLTFRETELFHEGHLPNQNNFLKYTLTALG